MEYIERDEIYRRWNAMPAPASTVSLAAAIAQTPAADVAPVRHGRWEECDYVEPCIHGFGTIRHKAAGLKCTNCVHVFEKNLLWKDNYCPNCGARMDLEVNDG